MSTHLCHPFVTGLCPQAASDLSQDTPIPSPWGVPKLKKPICLSPHPTFHPAFHPIQAVFRAWEPGGRALKARGLP